MRVTCSAAAALLEDSRQPEEIRRDAGGALHPARAGWQQWFRVAVLDESPERVLAITDGAIDEGVSQGDREGGVLIATVALPRAEDDIAGPGRAAAAPMVSKKPG